jgi:hypothetical protein
VGHEEVIKTGEKVKEKFINLMQSIIEAWAAL